MVAIAHFIPFEEPTEYHMKKKKICENRAELWNLVEKFYSKIFRSDDSVMTNRSIWNLIFDTNLYSIAHATFEHGHFPILSMKHVTCET